MNRPVPTPLLEQLRLGELPAETAARLRAEVDAFAAEAPGGLSVDVVFDQSGYTAERLVDVGGGVAAWTPTA